MEHTDVVADFRAKVAEAYPSMWGATTGPKRILDAAMSHMADELSMGKSTRRAVVEAMVRLGLVKTYGSTSRMKLLVKPEDAKAIIAGADFPEAQDLLHTRETNSVGRRLARRRKDSSPSTPESGNRMAQSSPQQEVTDDAEEPHDEESDPESSLEADESIPQEDLTWAARWNQKTAEAVAAWEKIGLDKLEAALRRSARVVHGRLLVSSPAFVLWMAFPSTPPASLSVAHKALQRLVEAERIEFFVHETRVMWKDYEDPECVYYFWYAQLKQVAVTVEAPTTPAIQDRPSGVRIASQSLVRALRYLWESRSRSRLIEGRDTVNTAAALLAKSDFVPSRAEADGIVRELEEVEWLRRHPHSGPQSRHIFLKTPDEVAALGVAA